MVFIFGCKITVYGDCTHEVKRGVFLGRKAMTKANSVLKSRDITLLTKIWIIKAMVVPVVVPERRMSIEELMLLNCGTGEDS